MGQQMRDRQTDNRTYLELSQGQQDTKELILRLFLPFTFSISKYYILTKMAPHADSEKAGTAPNEPGLDEPSAALQVGKFPK